MSLYISACTARETIRLVTVKLKLDHVTHINQEARNLF